MHYRRRGMTDAEMRAWLENQYDLNEGACWIWKGRKDVDGRGRVWGRGKDMLVHRLYWLLSGRTIPEGLVICHAIGCSKACYNPDHLRPDTQSANELDKHADGTMHTKLTEDQVRSIRIDERSQRVIADEYGVNHTTIGGIKSGRIWSWVI